MHSGRRENESEPVNRLLRPGIARLGIARPGGGGVACQLVKHRSCSVRTAGDVAQLLHSSGLGETVDRGAVGREHHPVQTVATP